MLLNLDTVIFCGFLAINLAVGLFYSRGIKSTSEYAIGNRDFSTKAIVTTIVATTIGAGTFGTVIGESYNNGLYFIIPLLCGDLFAMIIIGYFLVPRMTDFLGALSVAAAMGKIYGKSVRVICAIIGILVSIGVIAIQFKVAGAIMQLFFKIPNFYAMIFGSAIVILYSSSGGIKAVTFTDTLQFFTFSVIIPLICIAIWRESLDNSMEVFDTISSSPLFDYHEVLDYHNPRFLSSVSLFFAFVIPALMPEMFQRVSMANGVNQARKAFISAGFIVAVIYLITAWVGVVLLSSNPNLDSSKMVAHIIETYTFTGLKGLTAIGIMAALMSTADSSINSASVLLGHDVIRVFYHKPLSAKVDLLILRITASFIGIAALAFALKAGSLLKLFLHTLSLYMPIVTVPLLLAIFGFRSNTKVVLMGMATGGSTVLLWLIFGDPETSPVMLAMLVNLTVFALAHLLCGRPRNPSSVNHDIILCSIKIKRKQALLSFFRSIKDFSFVEFCLRSFPAKELMIGLNTILSVFLSMYFTTAEIRAYYTNYLSLIFSSLLIISFILITHPLYLSPVRNNKILAIFKMITIPYVLVFAPLLLSMINNFNQISLLLVGVNLVILIALTRWQLALSILVVTSYASIKVYESLTEGAISITPENFYIEPKFKVTYALLLVSSIIIAFLKPKQEAAQLAEEKVDHLSHLVEDQDKQIVELATHKQVFLRNIQHETNTPVTGVYSMSQALQDCYDKLSDKERKNAIATIVSSSERLISYVNNLIGISKLTNSEDNLKLREVDISNLLSEALRKCKRLYIPKDAEDDREITTQIEPDLKTVCDEYYIRKSFENLIINAIQYCKKGKIDINLIQEGGTIKLTLKDSGIGIPNEELSKIFDPFVTSSKTQTPAGGRGLGLTLVKAAIEAHKGSISVKSEPKSGSVFTLSLPASHKQAK